MCSTLTLLHCRWHLIERLLQADYRRSSVATKLKVIYVKDTVLDVRRAAGFLDTALTFSHSLHTGEDPVEGLYVFFLNVRLGNNILISKRGTMEQLLHLARYLSPVKPIYWPHCYDWRRE